ncbi:MAG: hypothetical protein ACOYL6_11125 [Bacteriovoracaceae bacterium]
MKRLVFVLSFLISLSSFAKCPQYAGLYHFTCEAIKHHHQDFSHTLITPKDIDGKPAVIEIIQRGCEYITVDNKADFFPEYPIYFESDKAREVIVKKAELEGNKLQLKYSIGYNDVALADGKDIFSITLKQDSKNGTLKIDSKVKMSNILSIWIPTKISSAKCTLTKI